MDLCASRGLLVSKILLHFETDFLVFSVDDRGLIFYSSGLSVEYSSREVNFLLSAAPER